MSEHQTLKYHETPKPEFGDPVLVSRTATDYLPHEKDEFAYVGNYQPKYLLIIWAMYIVWASWYTLVHYMPDIKNWYSKDPTALIYGNYDPSYWDYHVHDATVEGFLEKTDLKNRLKEKLGGAAPAAAPTEGAAPAAGGTAAPAETPAAGGEGGMSFPGAGDLEGVKSTTEPITPDDLK